MTLSAVTHLEGAGLVSAPSPEKFTTSVQAAGLCWSGMISSTPASNGIATRGERASIDVEIEPLLPVRP